MHDGCGDGADWESLAPIGSTILFRRHRLSNGNRSGNGTGQSNTERPDKLRLQRRTPAPLIGESFGSVCACEVTSCWRSFMSANMEQVTMSGKRVATRGDSRSLFAMNAEAPEPAPGSSERTSRPTPIR